VTKDDDLARHFQGEQVGVARSFSTIAIRLEVDGSGALSEHATEGAVHATFVMSHRMDLENSAERYDVVNRQLANHKQVVLTD
jgi:hypothetical protein